MFCHFQDGLFSHWPFLFAQEWKDKHKQNESPTEAVKDISERKEIPVNKDWLFVFTHDALDQDNLHWDASHTEAKDCVSQVAAVGSCNVAVQREQCDHYTLRNDLRWLSVFFRHTDFHKD